MELVGMITSDSLENIDLARRTPTAQPPGVACVVVLSLCPIWV